MLYIVDTFQFEISILAEGNRHTEHEPTSSHLSPQRSMRQFFKCSRRGTNNKQHSIVGNFILDSEMDLHPGEQACRSRIVGRRIFLKRTPRTPQPAEAAGVIKCSQNKPYSSRRGVSILIPMTMNQEMSSDTEHETRTKTMQLLSVKKRW